jgi:hypothetical protein
MVAAWRHEPELETFGEQIHEESLGSGGDRGGAGRNGLKRIEHAAEKHAVPADEHVGRERDEVKHLRKERHIVVRAGIENVAERHAAELSDDLSHQLEGGVEEHDDETERKADQCFGHEHLAEVDLVLRRRRSAATWAGIISSAA